MAVSSRSSRASNRNKSQNKMKQQTTNLGKPCHQCRNKPRNSAATCKNQNKPGNQRKNEPRNQRKNEPRNQRKNKPCTLLFCHQCLFNRYGEKAEEVELLEEWICPKCRGDCNCSRCMKKRGQEPTGIFYYKAKAAGYSSVSEFLHDDGHENFGPLKNAKDDSGSLKELESSGKGMEIMVAEGTVLNVQPLTAIPHQQYTMEEMNYPSEDDVEEVDEAAEDVIIEDAEIPQFAENPNSSPHQPTESPVLLLSVPSACISSEIAIPDSTHNIDEFVDDISDFKDHSHVKYPNAPPSPPFDYCDQMFPATIFDGAQGIGITLEENFELIKMIGQAENDAASQKRLTYHPLSDSPQKRKAMEEEIARVNQHTDEEGNQKISNDLVALRNDVDKLATKITRIDKEFALISHDVKNISKDVMTQAATTSANHQDLVEKVNLLQQNQDAYRETQLQMLSLLMEISNRLGNSVDDVTKGEKKVGGTSCRVEAEKKQPETAKEKSTESRKRKRFTTIKTGSDVLRAETIHDGEAPPEIMSEKSSTLVTSTSIEEAAPIKQRNVESPSSKSAYESEAFGQHARCGLGLSKTNTVKHDHGDSLFEPLYQIHLDKVETAFVVHKIWNGAVSGERLIVFLEGGRTMNIDQHQILSSKKQLLEYLVHIMHNRSFVHRRWISKMETKMRQITGLLTGAKELFKPAYICEKDGKEKEMPHGSVKIECDQLGRYIDYTQTQVGIKSITLDDIDTYEYAPSQLRAAYWQITGADDESVKVKRILKKALETAELKLLNKFLQKNPSLREIPDGYESDH